MNARIARYRIASPPLTMSAVDRATERRSDAAWLAAAWKDAASRVLVVGDGRVASDGMSVTYVAPREAPEGERFLLGVADGITYLATDISQAPEHGATLREIGLTLSDRDAGLATHAIALANWHATHQFCPRCGTRTRSEQGGHVRRCPADNSEHFPRTDPAVITLVVDENDRCLLGSGSAGRGNRFSTLAGFVEPGETPEAALVREVLEESGIEVTASRYAGSQPWPFPSNLMLGYYATARGVDPTPDGDEIREVRWFTRPEVHDAAKNGQIALNGAISISRRLIEGWLYAD